MSYQVLARKYRPASFKELEGQQHVLQALTGALDSARLHHAYLFAGTRGVGKTTIARILAKCLNCGAGVSAAPCGKCGSCTEIAEGRSLDLIEIDAASRTGVDDMRELLENVQYLPSGARFKIYLIDEVHMLSKSSFNAMLKTLEEPPEHVKFLFATTEPKRLPITVLSRCLQFNLKNLTPEQVVHHLQQVLDKESIGYEEAALWRLGHAADGSMRDALSLADQAISHGGKTLKDDQVGAMLGAIDQGQTLALLEAVLQEDGAGLLQQVAALAEFAPDYAGLLDSLLSLLHRLALAQAVPGSLDNSQGDKAALEALAAKASPEQVQLFYQIGLTGARDLPYAPAERTGFEMALLRMMSFARLDAESPQPTKMESPQPTKMESPQPAKIESALPAKPNSAAPKEQPAPKTAPAEVPPQPQPQEKPELSSGNWAQVLDLLDIGGLTKSLAAHCCLQSLSAGHCALVLGEEHASLNNGGHEERLAQALSAFYGKAFKVSIALGEPGEETPAQQSARQQQERQAKAKEAISQDTNVQRLIDGFNGKLDPDSIAPTGQ